MIGLDTLHTIAGIFQDIHSDDHLSTGACTLYNPLPLNVCCAINLHLMNRIWQK